MVLLLLMWPVGTSHFGGPMTYDNRKRHRFASCLIVVASLLLLFACSPLQPARPLDAQQIGSKIPARLNADPELQSLVQAISPVAAQGRGFETVITINGKEWSDRTRPQQ